MTADAPERIWIAPCHRCQGPDDYYLLHPDFRKGKGTEYLRADLATPTPAQAARVLLDMKVWESVSTGGPLDLYGSEWMKGALIWLSEPSNDAALRAIAGEEGQ